MIGINHTLISEDLLDQHFICDLAACKGECCVAGDAGAPVEEAEIAIMQEILPAVMPYLSELSQASIREQGVAIKDEDGDWVTPLNNGKECAFTIFENGTAKCGIEKAYLEGKVNFPKPISCHLYPVRLTEHSTYTAVNYHRWNICKAACACGKKAKVPLYQFLKNPLIRKFGTAWYDELTTIAHAIEAEKKS